MPQTYEAWIKLLEDTSGGVGAILGDYAGSTEVLLLLQIKENGVPQLHYRNGITKSQVLTTDFDQVTVPSGQWVHIAVVDDVNNGALSCYLNGELAQTVQLSGIRSKFKRIVASYPICIGGDTRDGNTLAFKGLIRSVAIYKDSRTADEIKTDMTSINLNDENLMSVYDLANSSGLAVFTDHKGDTDFKNNRMTAEWLDVSEVPEPTDFDYSIAIIGDTQMQAAYHPETLHTIFDWILEKKDSYKIQHVLNVGDFTNFNYDEEWELCVNQYFRLNGVIDYTLVRGDHDIKNDKIDNNGTDAEKYDRYFGVDAYLSRFNDANSGYYQSADGSITNSYRRVKIGNIDYLILTLDKKPSNAVVAWAKDILDKNTSEKVIMTMHCYLDYDGERLVKNVDMYAPTDFDGEDVWQQLASQYKNVQFVISGHKPSQNVVWTKDTGVNGNVVNQILVNAQGEKGKNMENNGPLGMVCLLYFKNDSDEVQVRYYSTFLNKYYSWDSQFTINMSDDSTPTSIKK